MANKLDADDAFLAAKAQVDEFMAELIAEWDQPDAELAMMITMVMQPPAVLQELSQMKPGDYKTVKKALETMGG